MPLDYGSPNHVESPYKVWPGSTSAGGRSGELSQDASTGIGSMGAGACCTTEGLKKRVSQKDEQLKREQNLQLPHTERWNNLLRGRLNTGGTIIDSEYDSTIFGH